MVWPNPIGCLSMGTGIRIGCGGLRVFMNNTLLRPTVELAYHDRLRNEHHCGGPYPHQGAGAKSSFRAVASICSKAKPVQVRTRLFNFS